VVGNAGMLPGNVIVGSFFPKDLWVFGGFLCWVLMGVGGLAPVVGKEFDRVNWVGFKIQNIRGK